MKEDFILKEGVYIYYEDLFGDSERLFDIKCYDGYAIATISSDEDIRNIEQVQIEYYTLAEVLSNAILSELVLKYNGLCDLSPKDINYGDIMMAYGRITKVIK
jgi:hypothetical protein